MKKRVVLLAAAGLLVGASQKPKGFVPHGGPQPVTAELVSEHASIRPGGQTRIGVHFDLEEGWHIYAKDPGDAGMPTTITWSGPSGVNFGPLQWPQAERFMDPGDIRTFGYSGSTVLSTTLRLSRSAGGGLLPITAKIEWLACKDICIPGAVQLTLSLPVSQTPPVRSPHAELFDHVTIPD